jgi:hypothetical protein
MSLRYVNDKTTTMYNASTGSARAGYLILGDEVDKTGNASNG